MPDGSQKQFVRIEGLTRWLCENAPECRQQTHLKTGSPERAYWHFGYLAALHDVRNLLLNARRMN